MKFEFDHLFICTDVDASVADRLAAFGLVEGSSRTHPGQGTANRRFFFHNAMLELLWVDDPAAAQSEPIQRTQLWKRWIDRTTGACPFGICLRPAPGSAGEIAFPSWDYRPPYLPPASSIAVGTNSGVLTEPMLFQIPFGQRPDRFPAETAQPLEHGVGFQEITRVQLISPHPPSPELQAVLDTHLLNLQAGTVYCVELGFDGERQQQRVDFRPDLPLIICW
jgi:Glyoxalase-like domain